MIILNNHVLKFLFYHQNEIEMILILMINVFESVPEWVRTTDLTVNSRALLPN